MPRDTVWGCVINFKGPIVAMHIFLHDYDRYCNRWGDIGVVQNVSTLLVASSSVQTVEYP